MEETGPPPTLVVDEDLELRITQFIWARDQLAKIDAKWEAERAEIVNIKNRLEARLQLFLESRHIESAKTKAGTAYTTTKYSASLADPQQFMDYVVNTGQFDLLERRASVTAVRQFVEDNKVLPAGCNLSSHKSLRVRR